MRFSIDAHALGQHLTGNEVYVRNLLTGLAALDGEAEFIAYTSVEDAAQWVPAGVQQRRVSASPYWRLGFDLSRKLREDQPELVHVQYTAPVRCPAPVVASIHDVSFWEHPEYFAAPRALQLQYTVPRTARRAARILTPSEFSRRAIIRAFALPENAVEVVPNAVSDEFRPRQRDEAAAEIARRFGIPSPFILTVGDLRPRKNQERLIHAFAALLQNHRQLPHHLVLVGQQTFPYGVRVRGAVSRCGLTQRVHFPGFVSDRELLRFYGACDLFVFPSLYEGFGLPILEAMACGRAVACSKTTSMPEVADKAAVLFDPESTGEICQAMRDLLLDAEHRKRMERAGLKRASAFSWERSAEKTLAVYYAVARAPQPARLYRIKSVSA